MFAYVDRPRPMQQTWLARDPGQAAVIQFGLQAHNGESMVGQSRVEAGQAHDLEMRARQDLFAADHLERNASEQESQASALEQQAASARNGAQQERTRATDLDQRAAALRQQAQALRQRAQQDREAGTHLVDIGQRAERDGSAAMREGRGYYLGIVDSRDLIESGDRLRHQGQSTTRQGQQRLDDSARESQESTLLEAQAAQLEIEATRARGNATVGDQRACELESTAATVRQHVVNSRSEAGHLRGSGQDALARSRALLDASRQHATQGQADIEAGTAGACAAMQMRQQQMFRSLGLPPTPMMWAPPLTPLQTFHPVSWHHSHATYDRHGHARKHHHSHRIYEA